MLLHFRFQVTFSSQSSTEPMYLSSDVSGPLSAAGTSMIENADEDILSHFTEVICSKAIAELELLLYLWTRAESMELISLYCGL